MVFRWRGEMQRIDPAMPIDSHRERSTQLQEPRFVLVQNFVTELNAAAR